MSKKIILLILVFISIQLNSQNFWQKTVFPSGSQLNSVHSMLGLGNNEILVGTFAMGVYKSTDNGNNWNSSGLSSHWIIDIKPDRLGNIYVLSIGSTFGSGVFKSTDNGNNWSKVWSYEGGLNCLYVDANNNIYVGLNFSGGQGGVYKSSNGGSSWDNIFNFPANVYAIIKANNGNLLLAVYENGLAHIYRSSNEGGNWNKYSFPINFTSTDFAINSQGAIYLSTAGYGIYYSTDNGINWSNIASVGPDFSCLLIDGNTVYAGTRGNWVYRSIDGTSNWTLINSGMNQDNYVLSLGATNNGYLFAGMDYAGIYRSINQVLSAENGSQVVTDFNLYQNYPNPFNPVTTISYQIKEQRFVQMKVHNLLGQEIATLVNEYQPAGKYEVLFDASAKGINSDNLSSGVYIYSLRVNEFVQNKKMTLLK